jgi:hypothetical protein
VNPGAPVVVVVVGRAVVVVVGSSVVVVVGSSVVVVVGWQVRPPTHSPSQQAPLQQVSPGWQKSWVLPLLITSAQLPSPSQSWHSAHPTPREATS